MTKAKLENGTPVQPYPYTLRDLHAESAYAGTSWPKGVWPADSAETFNVVDVVETPAPVPTATQRVTKALPALIEGIWTQQWTVADWTAEEIAAHEARQAETASKDAIDAEVEADNFITQLLSATNVQIDNKVDQFVTNLATAKDLFKKIIKLQVSEMRRNRGL